MNAWRALFGAGLFATSVVAGCTADRAVMQTGLPGGRARASISLIAERGDHLDVEMESGGVRYRFFLPNDAACEALFVSEAAVFYENTGAFGRLSTDATRCEPVGILSLAEWRNRGPRRQTTEVIPRARAELREVAYIDDDVVLIRGRYLLAREIGFVGGADSIVVIPRVEECEGIPEARQASMEFRPAGRTPYTLINGRMRCPVLGFVQPPPNP
jgi:hypothetical protein